MWPAPPCMCDGNSNNYWKLNTNSSEVQKVSHSRRNKLQTRSEQTKETKKWKFIFLWPSLDIVAFSLIASAHQFNTRNRRRSHTRSKTTTENSWKPLDSHLPQEITKEDVSKPNDPDIRWNCIQIRKKILFDPGNGPPPAPHSQSCTA